MSTKLSETEYKELFNYCINKDAVSIRSSVYVYPDRVTTVVLEITLANKNSDIDTFSWVVKRLMDELEGFIKISASEGYIELTYSPLFCYDQDNDLEGYKVIAEKTNAILFDILNLKPNT